MSIILNNGVQNIKGTPGIIQDSFVNIPAANTLANGTIFIDTVSLNILINISGIWTLLYAGGGSTPNIDTVLAQGGTLSANRQIDGDGGAWSLDLLGLFSFFARNPDGNGIFAYFDSNQIEIKNNQLSSYPSNMSLFVNDVQLSVDSQGFYADSSTTSRQASIGDVQGQYNGTALGVDDLNNTLTVKGNNITSNTAGGNSGKHLKININGIAYKIALSF
jgi:hypothetical protein